MVSLSFAGQRASGIFLIIDLLRPGNAGSFCGGYTLPPKRIGLEASPLARTSILFSRVQAAHTGGLLLGSPVRTRQRWQNSDEHLLQLRSACPHVLHLLLLWSSSPKLASLVDTFSLANSRGSPSFDVLRTRGEGLLRGLGFGKIRCRGDASGSEKLRGDTDDAGEGSEEDPPAVKCVRGGGRWRIAQSVENSGRPLHCTAYVSRQSGSGRIVPRTPVAIAIPHKLTDR